MAEKRNGKQMVMTYAEYDRLLEVFKQIKAKETVMEYWPSVEQMDQFEINPEKWILYCCYLYECNEPPKNPTEHYSKKNLLAFIGRYLVLTE